MAKGRKTGGKNFQPGVVTNPKGRPRIPDDIRMANELTKNEFIRVVNKYLYLTKEQIQAELKNSETPALNLMIIGLISKAVSEGDQHRLNFLLDRLLGKVPTPIQTTVDPLLIDALKKLEGKSNEELLALLSHNDQD